MLLHSKFFRKNTERLIRDKVYSEKIINNNTTKNPHDNLYTIYRTNEKLLLTAGSIKCEKYLPQSNVYCFELSCRGNCSVNNNLE